MKKDPMRRPNINEIVKILKRTEYSVREDRFVICSLTILFIVIYVFCLDVLIFYFLLFLEHLFVFCPLLSNDK